MEEKIRQINIKKIHTNIILIFSTFAATISVLLGLWTVDVAVSSMLAMEKLNKIGIESKYVLTNGYRITEPIQAYHQGLWLVIAATVTFVLIIIICSFYSFKFNKELEHERKKRESSGADNKTL